MINRTLFLFCFFWLLVSCGSSTDETKTNPQEAPFFAYVGKDSTGITFSNTIIENDSINIIDYEYTYNGSGVGIGDLNNDGLKDIVFGANLVTSEIYINKGNLKFEKLPESSGFHTERWVTGVALVDINSDGWEDIYLSVAGRAPENRRANLLFINQGEENGQISFVEKAADYGLDFTGYTTQAAFMDFDKDNDLDVILINHANDFKKDNAMNTLKEDGTGISNDRLFRNDNGKYIDITREAGILTEGYSLGISVADFNSDGWDDFYISNDYYYDDLLYINNQNGTFSEKGSEFFYHFSNFSMGNDMADINNDGKEDLIVLDMLPDDNYRKQKLIGPLGLDMFNTTLQLGYEPQFMRNTLQLQNETGRFSEIGMLADMYATDWSWAPLITDFDNDGWSDIYITNGFLRDMTDRDFVLYRVTQERKFGAEAKEKVLKILHDMEGAYTSNYIFSNNKDLTFSDKSDAWGITKPSYSNGAAYGDLDNDGDLDLVVNNIQDPAFLIRNLSTENGQESRNYLRVNLDGADSVQINGTIVELISPSFKLNKRYYRYRGFQSTVESELHFGLGQVNKLDSIILTWNNGYTEVFNTNKINTTITIQYGQGHALSRTERSAQSLLQNVDSLIPNYTHSETTINDFKREPLMLYRHSKLGPGIAVGDVNGDNLEDFIIGGSSGFAATLFTAKVDGTFDTLNINKNDAHMEDMGLLLFDADQDGDNDLYVVSGGNDIEGKQDYYQDRLYLNSGKGNFIKVNDALPQIRESGSCVRASDFDSDGDLDLFIGGRQVAGFYPVASGSYLLRNDNGKFTDITAENIERGDRLGLVTDAIFSDFSGDGLEDLIIVGEWMNIRFYQNTDGSFEDVTEESGISEIKGWWNSISGSDLDNDGDMDYIVGNLGLNNPFNVKENQPLEMYVADFDNNNKIDPILAIYDDGEQYTYHSRDMLMDQMAYVRKQFNKYKDFAVSSFDDVLTQEKREKAYKLTANQMAHGALINNGDGKFSFIPLPNAAQIAPIYGMQVFDIDGDQIDDILAIGNNFNAEVSNGNYDAGRGIFMKGNGDGTFSVIDQDKSGFLVEGDAKSMARLLQKDNILLLCTQNSGPLKTYNLSADRVLKLESTDKSVFIEYDNGSKKRIEVYYGDAYLSQSSRFITITGDIKKITVTDIANKERTLN